jgi:hypothetical protein
MSAAEFAEARLFGPLGIGDWRWTAHDRHTSVGGAGLYLRPADMAKLGRLYLQRGMWNGEQIVPEAWVDASTSSRGAVNRWSDYGYSWWLYSETAARDHLDGHDDIFYALGRGGQFVWVLPHANAVIACTGWNEGTGRWPESMLWDFLGPALAPGNPPLGEPRFAANELPGRTPVEELEHPRRAVEPLGEGDHEVQRTGLPAPR